MNSLNLLILKDFLALDFMRALLYNRYNKRRRKEVMIIEDDRSFLKGKVRHLCCTNERRNEMKKDLAYYQAKEAKQQENNLKARVKRNLYVEKAKAAGIIVTDVEVEAEMKRISQ